MTTLVFTICARNYIGLAKVLGQSVARYGRDVDFCIYVAEGIEDPEISDITLVSAPQALKDIISPVEFANMAFMYNVTELCTSLKAACFIHGFDQGYNKCIYMDPDTYLVADIAHITLALEDCAILITPHLCLPAKEDGPRTDHGILATGVYNLGFLAVRRTGEAGRFLEWWHERLRFQAFNDHYRALYTDQRWVDFVPSLFSAEAVRIWRHLGCNVAPWNYHERHIQASDEGFVVRPRRAIDDLTDGSHNGGQNTVPLVFLHFSGFDFRRILDGRFDQLNLAGAETYADLLPLYDLYGDAIRAASAEMTGHLSSPYGFDRFNDGAMILPSHRRLFRVWRERHGDASDPFAVGPGSFHAALRSRGLLGRPGPTDLAADKATAQSIANSAQLMGRAQAAFRLVFRVLGRSRFFILVRSLNRLSNVEQHYDTFRLDDASIVVADQELSK